MSELSFPWAAHSSAQGILQDLYSEVTPGLTQVLCGTEDRTKLCNHSIELTVQLLEPIFSDLVGDINYRSFLYF